MNERVAIIIPTYNRAFCLKNAIDSALSQSYPNICVLVVDDGSNDETEYLASSYEYDHRFSYVKLANNVGTANAKNVGIMLANCDAITFHDSDDIPSRDKVLMQVRALYQQNHVADPILDWPLLGYEAGQNLPLDIVVGAHDMVKLNGSLHRMEKRLSLIDDFFPTVQFPSKTEGDWILINSGLFRHEVFQKIGGYLDSVEEDRELRNRMLGCGFLFYYLEQSLLTKIEMPASLTTDADTGYRGDKRIRDRDEVRKRTRIMLANFGQPNLREQLKVTVDIPNIAISKVINRHLLTFNSQVAHTPATARSLAQFRVNPTDVSMA